TTDASMFNNELLDSYDNAQFGKNIINWLTKQNKSIAVVFDESHNIPYGTREFSSVAMFGFIQGYVNWLSTNPLISWIYPLYALRTVKRWLPKDEDKKKKKKKEEIRSSKERDELQFRTSSFFAQKINWYRINQEYNQALILLNRRVERKVMNLMEGVAPTAVNIIEKISAERGKYLSKVDLERIRNYLEKMEAIKSKQIEVVDILEFNDIFFEMNWFNENF
ncbi:MAG: hypothetical protein GY870_22615, partial [archaeon]|nr:hypothetical protein [archaeon]